MAKRKRKMTLFDVMHTGQSVGLQVRTRVPSYQPTPELPVTKKLAKLFGRAPRSHDENRPRSAADELADLRRELASKNPVAAAEVNTPERASEDHEVSEAPLVSSFNSEPTAPPSRRSSVHDLARGLEQDEARNEPRAASTPRKPMGQVWRDLWANVSPKFSTLGEHLNTGLGRGANQAARGLGIAREMYGRYAVTTGAALGVLVLLCGSFYAGKLLFNRPASGLAGDGEVATNNVRSDVLEINNATKSNEAIANIDSQPETKLERAPDAPLPKSSVFGGRRPDLNYVIIQSYLSQAEASATVDVLAKHNVKTTVELNLPRWAMAGKNLYSVVSAEGFGKMTGNQEFQAYLANIARISDQEAGNTLPKKLDPRPYKLQPAAAP